MRNISYKKSILYFCILIMIVLILWGGQRLAAASSVPAPTITIIPDTYYPLDDILYIEGRATAGSPVEIQFQKQGARPLKFTSKTDQDGEWVLAEKVSLSAGDWQVMVRAADPKRTDTLSNWSNPRVFKVVVNGITIAGLNIKPASLAFITFILLLCGAGLIVYFQLKMMKFKKLLLNKEIQEAEQSVHRGFSGLRQNILDELKVLESRKNLSQEELIRREHLLHDLEDMEHGMEKEIRDIEERV